MSSASVFRVPGEIHFGVNLVEQVGAVARRYGQRAMVVSGVRSAKASGAWDRLRRSLEQSGMSVQLFDRVGHEPTVEIVQDAITAARDGACHIIIGLGGGSAIDAAKCAAGLFYSRHRVAAHFAGEAELPQDTLPWIAVPTTAGAGAEATPNAVLIDEKTGMKKSIRSWGWLAKAAFVDPQLTVSCPKTVTAHSGMDAFVQAVESYTSRWATPLTSSISFEAALRIARALPQAYDQGEDVEARTAVAWGATMAGIALANARLGAVHGFAHPVGVHCRLPHGQVCAMLLPPVAEYNLDVAADKYARLARELGAADRDQDDAGAAQRFIAFVRGLNAKLEIPATLGEVGLQEEMLDDIVEQTLPSGSLAANPRRATAKDLKNILLGQL